MSVAAESSGQPGVSQRAGWLGVMSLVSPAGIVVIFPLAFFLGSVLLGMGDLEGSEPMEEQGTYGWMVLILLTLLMSLPTIVGFLLGRKALNLGNVTIGKVGMTANLVIGLGLAVLIVGGAALS